MRGIPVAVLLSVAILVAAILSAGCAQEAPGTGSLEITSTPPGLEVQVILDGDFRGVSPLVLTNLSEGSHLLQLRSADYAERVQLVTITAGQRMKVAADYPPIPTPTPVPPTTLPTPETPTPTVTPTELPETPLPPGSLYVSSFPSGATIYLDGRGYGTTPRMIGNLTPKSYELRLSLVGWKDYKVVLSVSPGLTTTENALLRQ
ncbi:MAG TPA: PEGA domain-containing protein [Methanomicrobiales archaeon]|nr:PEGA domain-containing protein [Methanomicrobiales archaeon]